MTGGIPFPDISPEIFTISLFGLTFALRWYAMGYIVGIMIGWWIATRAIKRPALWRNDTPPLTRDHGVCVAATLAARRYGAALGDVANILALTATPAILLVRLANFINAELFGRATDLPWGMKFPSMCFDNIQQPCTTVGEWFYYGTEVTRHPSQLYEAGLEGLLLGAIILNGLRHVPFHRRIFPPTRCTIHLAHQPHRLGL